MSLKDHFKYGVSVQSGVIHVIRRSESDSEDLNVVKKRTYLRPIRRPNYCQTKKRDKGTLNLDKRDWNKSMCLDLEAGHNSDQSQNFSEDGNLDAVLRENLDPATDAGNRCENYSSGENKTRRRRVSKRSRKTLSRSDEDDVNEENKNASLSLEVKTCELCSKRFQNSHAFTLHLKEHNSNSNRNNGDAYVCTLCNKSLSSKSSLDRHALVHSGYKPHKCGICGILFTTNGNMNRHIRTHDEKKRKCAFEKHTCAEECNHGFSDMYHLEFSNSKFPQIAQLECEKKRRCPPPSYKKMKLDKGDSDQELLDALRVYLCDRCSHCFPCQRTLSVHQQDCLRCRNCEVQFSNNNEFENHVQSHDHSERNEKLPPIANIKKEGCEAVDENTIDDKEGEMNIVNNLEKKENIFGENIEGCKDEARRKAMFLSFLGLTPVRQQPNHSNEMKGEPEKRPQISESPQTSESPQISEDIPYQGELVIVIDESVSSNNSPSNDDDDDNCSDSKHSASSSSSEKFSPEKNNSSQHMNEIPSSVENIAKSLPCSMNETPKSPADSSQQQVKFQCKQCPSTFFNIKSFKAHSKDHSQLKKYKCDECSYKSADKSTLHRHMRTHNGIKPYKCQICNYEFTTKTNTQRHIRKKHHIPRGEDEKYAVYNIGKPESNSSAIVANENPSETTCKYCNVYFGNTRLLKHHLRSLRDSCNCKPFICRKCGKGFSTKNNCTRHINKTHPEYKSKIEELLVYNESRNNGQLKQGVNRVDDDTKTDSSQQGNSENEDSIMQVDSEENQELENGDVSMHSDSEDNQREKNNDEPANFGFNSQKDVEELHVPERLALPGYPGSYRELLNTSDVVSAVDGLMSLSKSVPFQGEPLDLSVRPIDLSSKDLKIPNNVNTFSLPVLTFSEKFENSVPVNLSTSTMHNPKAQSTSKLQEFRNNMLPLRSITPLEHMTQSLNLIASAPASVPEGQISNPVDYSLADKSAIPNFSSSEVKIPSHTSVPEKKTIPCNYCHKTFTLKSNKERHVKNHHPERARPPRSRNFIPMFQGASLQKQTPNVSDVTKDKLRSVLMPKVSNGSGLSETDFNIDGETLSLVIEKNEKIPEISNKNIVSDDYLKHGSRNDYETNDLASVSSVINTVNSKEINRFLKDASLTDSQTSTEEKLNNPENGALESSSSGSACDTERRHKCDHCERAFIYVSARERHMATHSGVRPFICSKCNGQFTTKSNRDRHEKNSCCEKPTYKNKSYPVKDRNKSRENGLSQTESNEAINLTDSKRTDLRPRFVDNLTAVYGQSACNQLAAVCEQSVVNQLAAVSGQSAGNQRSNSNVNAFFPHGILNNNFHAVEHSNPLVNNSGQLLNLEHPYPKQSFECKFCKNTYKDNNDLTNHMKELHPLEYKSLMGEAFNPEDTIQSWKKNGSGKRKTI